MFYNFTLYDAVGDETIKVTLLRLTLLSDCSNYDNEDVAPCPCSLLCGVGDIMWIVLYLILGLEEGNKSEGYHHHEPDECTAQP